jgi:hypothetical protein
MVVFHIHWLAELCQILVNPILSPIVRKILNILETDFAFDRQACPPGWTQHKQYHVPLVTAGSTG